MTRFGTVSRVGAAVAAGGLVLGLSALPAGSQVLEPITITGTAECVNMDGDYVWAIDYTIHNDLQPPQIVGSVPAAVNDVSIDSAEVTGAVSGSPPFTPNPVAAGEDSFSDTGVFDGSTAGLVTLTVGWSVSSLEDSGTATYDLTLDGTCVAPATTTTAAPAVQAVAVTPSFTG